MSELTWDRVKESLAAMVRVLTAHHDYGALYAATVRNQQGDGTVGVDFDDDRWPAVDGVALKVGLPGCSLKVSPGARCLVGFENQDPSKPRVMQWEASSLLELVLTAATKVTVSAPQVLLGDGTAAPIRYGDVITLAPAGVSPLAAAGGLAVAGIATITPGAPQSANPVPTKVKA
jgi:hypothetical protein